MLGRLAGKKLQVDYPCRWQYKVISMDHESDQVRIATMLERYECTLSLSNSSKSGKYTCINVEIMVQGEEHRNSVLKLLRDLKSVKMVL